MNVHIHSSAGGTCLADLERDGYAHGADPEGITILLTTEAARNLDLSMTLGRLAKHYAAGARTAEEFAAMGEEVQS